MLAGLYAPAAKLAPEVVQTALIYQAVVLGLGSALGYWLSGTAEADRWERLRLTFPRAAEFGEQAYRTDRILEKLVAGFAAWSALSSRIFERGLWLRLLPGVSDFLIGRFSPAMGRLDERLRRALMVGLSKLIAAPGQGLQVIQSGDLQWYLFFALTVGIGFILVF
jgi:hypothetical protein